jgi:hypothetical protein
MHGIQRIIIGKGIDPVDLKRVWKDGHHNFGSIDSYLRPFGDVSIGKNQIRRRAIYYNNQDSFFVSTKSPDYLLTFAKIARSARNFRFVSLVAF